MIMFQKKIASNIKIGKTGLKIGNTNKNILTSLSQLFRL